MELSPGILALIGTIIGSIGLKLLENYLGRSRHKVDDATQIRQELRAELDKRDDEITRLEADRDKWKGLYYDLRDQNVAKDIELATLRTELARHKS